PVDSVLASRSRFESVRGTLEALPDETPVYIADQWLMNEVVGLNIHRGLLAAGLRGHEPSAAEVAAKSRVLLALEALTNHDNLGSMFRNAAALAGPRAGILLSPRCADPLDRKSVV